MSNILLVEDNPSNAELIIRLLKTAGHDVTHLDRGLEAAKVVRNSDFDLILMDFNLPDFDGRTLVLTIKKSLKETCPPIVAITARTGPGEESLAQRFGCSAFIGKPFASNVFLDTVETVLRGESQA